MNDDGILCTAPTDIDEQEAEALDTLRARVFDALFPTDAESGLVAHARQELEAVGLFDADSDYGGALGHAVIELMRVFAAQGHSGMSAPCVVAQFQKLAMYEPLAPLTGAAEEWTLVSEGLEQNRRCSHVFRDERGAYDIQGKVFVEPSGGSYTSRDSHVPVTFPYTPTTEYVHVAGAAP